MKWIQNWAQGTLTVLGIDGRSSRLYHIEWLASTRIPDGKGGSVYREDRYECYRVGTELHMGGRRWKKHQEEEIPMENYSEALINAPNGVIDSINSMREQDLYDIMMFSEIIL
jgi:hypothetical protein